jgi:hypothetical protein
VSDPEGPIISGSPASDKREAGKRIPFGSGPPHGEAYRLEGRVTGEKKDKIVFAESEILSADGEAVARASGKLFKVRA